MEENDELYQKLITKVQADMKEWTKEYLREKGYTDEKKTNTLAIISFIAVMLFFVPLSGVAGFIMGIISLEQIKEKGESGKGLAVTSIVLGSLSIAFWCILVLAEFL